MNLRVSFPGPINNQLSLLHMSSCSNYLYHIASGGMRVIRSFLENFVLLRKLGLNLNDIYNDQSKRSFRQYHCYFLIRSLFA